MKTSCYTHEAQNLCNSSLSTILHLPSIVTPGSEEKHGSTHSFRTLNIPAKPLYSGSTEKKIGHFRNYTPYPKSIVFYYIILIRRRLLSLHLFHMASEFPVVSSFCYTPSLPCIALKLLKSSFTTPSALNFHLFSQC